MTRQSLPWMQGPEGRPPNVSPARKGWEINPENDLSAVGAALNLLSAVPTGLLLLAFGYPGLTSWAKFRSSLRDWRLKAAEHPGPACSLGAPWRDLLLRRFV